MKKVNLLVILLMSMLVSCQQKNGSIKKNAFTNKAVYMKVDTINGKAVIDDRCGVDAPSIKIFKDSLYYYYPTEGSYYKIIDQKISGNTIFYSTIILPSDENSNRTNFKIININESLLKVFIDNQYAGIFINSNLTGKKIQIYHRKDCDDEVASTNDNNIDKNSQYPIFQGTTWNYDCKTSDYVTFTLNVAQFNFYTMDFGINTDIKKINEYEFELRFRSPPIIPIPENMDWKNYSKDEVVSKIKYKNGEMELTWLGFYNTKSKKREYAENPFTGKIEKSSIILKKCK